MVGSAIYLSVLFLVYTAGPLDIFRRFRRLLGIVQVYDVDGVELHEESNGDFWADIFTCHRCATPYVSLPVIILWYFVPLAVYAMGVMGLAVWLAEVSKRE